MVYIADGFGAGPALGLGHECDNLGPSQGRGPAEDLCSICSLHTDTCDRFVCSSLCIYVALNQMQCVILFCKNYRNEGLTSSINIIKIKSIAHDMGIEPKFPTKHHATRKKQSDESRSNEDEERQLAEESFRVHYFLVTIDMAIASLNSRFEQLIEFEKVFGFLFNSINLKSLDDDDLQKYCTKFAETYSW
jgi:hypothetical protein